MESKYLNDRLFQKLYFCEEGGVFTKTVLIEGLGYWMLKKKHDKQYLIPYFNTLDISKVKYRYYQTISNSEWIPLSLVLKVS